MNKNVKRIFFIATLVTVLILVSAVNATNTTDKSIDNTLNEKTSTQASKVVKEETPTKEKIETQKNKEITKTNKTKENTKTTTKTVEVTDGNSLSQAFNDAQTETGYDKYIIELNEGDYSSLNTALIWKSQIPLLLNGNNQTLPNVLSFGNQGKGEAIIYNINVNCRGVVCTLSKMELYNSKINASMVATLNNVTNLYNSTITVSTMNNNGELLVDDFSIIEAQKFLGNGILISNQTIGNYTRVITGDHTFEKTTLNTSVIFQGVLNIINCNITAPLTNNGISNIINSTFQSHVTNNGNLSVINCTLSNVESSGNSNYNALFIDNYGNLTMTGCVMENNTYNGYPSYNNYNQFGMIYNNATLVIDNCTFKNNRGMSQAGVIYSYISPYENVVSSCSVVINNSVFRNNSLKEYGSAISLTNTNLTISNTVFENHHVTYGNRNDGVGDGACIHLSNGNLTVTNSTFNNNSYSAIGEYDGDGARGTAIYAYNTNANIYDSTFTNNNAQVASAWNDYQAMGGAVYISNGDWQFVDSNSHVVDIQNNYFENNRVSSPEGIITANSGGGFKGVGGSLYINSNQTIINNNTFKNEKASFEGGSIVAIAETLTIQDNTFTNIESENNETLYTQSNQKTMTNNTYTNSTIGFNNLVIEDPGKLYAGDTTTLKANIELSHPEYYDSDLLEKTKYNWYINGETITTDTPEYTLTVENTNMMIYVTPSITNTRSQLLVITPTVLGDKIITPENIEQYLFMGQLVAIPENTKLIFQGEFTNLGEINSKTNNLLLDGSEATFTNTSFVIEANETTIQNMNINNTDTTNYIITTIGNNNIIRNNTLKQYNTNGLTAAIKDLNSQNTIITQNNIIVSGPAKATTASQGATISNTQAILSINATQSTITYNNITVTNSTDPETEAFGTIEAITAPRGTNNKISYNNIQCTGARFNYGINTLDNVLENTITYNNITVTGYRYTDGIQVGNGANNNYIANNNINLTCLNDTPVDEAAISYGIIVTSQGGLSSDNNTVTQNKILINGAVNYGCEIYTATNTLITENNITLNGVKSMGIGYAHSPNSTVKDNIIIINDDSTKPLNSITEEIQPLSVGIRVQQESNNIQIEDNTITTNDIAKTDKTIDTTGANTTIKNNKLISSTGYGEDTIKTTQTDTTIENNVMETTTTIEDINGLKNTPTTLTATVTDELDNKVNGGSVIFTDPEGNIIATAEVIDGTATTTVTFTEETTTQITATYTPTSTGLETSTATATLTIEAPQTILTIEDITLTAGQTVTLTAKVTDQLGNNITGGKIVFKVNGKTLKDTNGKVIYAKVVNGIATVEYTVPKTGESVNITASYSGYKAYNAEKTSVNMNITRPETTLTVTPIEQTTPGTTVTLTATLNDNTINTGKIVFKINGKTVKDEKGKTIYAKVVNGQVSMEYTLPENMKAGNYTLTATFIGAGYDRLTDEKTLKITA